MTIPGRPRCTHATHGKIKSLPVLWRLHTERLTQSPDREAYQEDDTERLWLRNCIKCGSTLALEVEKQHKNADENEVVS